MNELKRIYTPKTLMLIAAVIIINMGLFILSCAPEKQITLTGTELKEYISEYPEFLENTKKNSENMSLLNMYKSGFASDNIGKTARAYKELENVNAKYGDNRGIVLFYEYGLSDILLLAFLMIMTLKFFGERKKGLANLVRSTNRGRGTLYLQRIAILLLSAAAIGVLLYGGNFLCMLMKFGSGELSRSIQSLPEFKECVYGFSIGEYLLLSCLLKISACFVSALAFFLAISVLGTAAAYTLTAAAAAFELLMFKLIPSVSSFNALKFINIFSIIKCDSFLSVCRNINIFGKAVSVLRCNAVFLTAAAALLLLAGYIVHGKMYVKNKKFLDGLINRLGRAAEKIPLRRGLFGWESFKLLFKQGGLFFMAAVFFLALGSAMKYDLAYPVNIVERSYYEKYHGTVTESMLEEVSAEFDEWEEKAEFYQNAYNEMLADKTASETTKNMISTALKEAIMKRDGLLSVKEDISSGLEYFKKTGKSVRLIKSYTYDALLNKDKQSSRSASLYILIGIIGAVSGVFAYDRQNNMKNTLRSSYCGRIPLLTAKTASVMTVCVILCVSIHLIQIIRIGNMLGFNDLTAPVQSIPFMRDFKPYVSIQTYIIMLFAVRSAAAFLAGLVCMAISGFCSDTTSAMGISAFFLAVPSVLAEILPTVSNISFVYLISGNYFRA